MVLNQRFLMVIQGNSLSWVIIWKFVIWWLVIKTLHIVNHYNSSYGGNLPHYIQLLWCLIYHQCDVHKTYLVLTSKLPTMGHQYTKNNYVKVTTYAIMLTQYRQSPWFFSHCWILCSYLLQWPKTKMAIWVWISASTNMNFLAQLLIFQIWRKLYYLI
jgi:hypothetical protein